MGKRLVMAVWCYDWLVLLKLQPSCGFSKTQATECCGKGSFSDRLLPLTVCSIPLRAHGKVSGYMLSRRDFLFQIFAGVGMAAFPHLRASALERNESFVGETVFNRIIATAAAERWRIQPMGELSGRIAMSLVGTPYVADTLELSTESEICSVNLTGLDCVTFFETTLALARMIKKGLKTPEDLLAQVRYMRYRNGTQGDYTTRLHYMSEWFVDNERKKVVSVLRNLPGSLTFSPRVSFMSDHPQSYRQLAGNTKLTEKIREIERDINRLSLTYVPVEEIAIAEAQLKTGDIVAICKNIKGLDTAHTGLVFRTRDGVVHLIDASSLKKNMRVVLEPNSISATLKNWKATGAIFARPLEP